MLPMGAAQAQTVSPVPDISVWQLLGADIPFLVMNVLVVMVFIIVIVTVRRMNQSIARIADRLDRAAGAAG